MDGADTTHPSGPFIRPFVRRPGRRPGPFAVDTTSAAVALAGIDLPDPVGRPPGRDHHVMRESAYLGRVWEAYRLSTDEKAVLLAFLEDEILPALPQRNGPLALLDVGPDDGTLTRCVCGRFGRVTLLEPDPASMGRLGAACEARACADGRCERIGVPFGDADLGDRRYDLVLLSHVLYYMDRAEWPSVMARAYDLLRPGGMAVAAYVCDDNELGDLLRTFDGRPLDFAAFETDVTRARPDMQPLGYRMAGDVRADNEHTFLHLLGFLMADRHAWAPLTGLRRYAERFRRPDGSYRLAKTDGALVLRKSG